MTLDTAWLDAQYNNRARVPGHEAVMERWTRASELARDKASRRLDLRYGDGTGETLDLFPAPRRDAPVLVFIHGGYWRSLDKSDFSFVAPAFVAAGACVVVPNYALCPAVSMETIALQMTRAIAWVWRHAAQYGADAKRIVVAGHSAGGHLAAMLMCCDWKAVDPALPQGLVGRALSISGLFDLDPLVDTPFLRDDLRLTRESALRLSPATFPRPAGTLHAVAGGAESEEFLRQNRLIRERWGERTVPVCEELPGCNHFDIVQQLVDPRARLHGHARDLLGLP